VTSWPAGAPRARRHQLAAELRRTRLLAGLSGRDLAQATGVSQSTISRAERGQAVLDVALHREQLDRLRQSALYGADALNIVRSIAHP